jgi:hypothetical protein
LISSKVKRSGNFKGSLLFSMILFLLFSVTSHNVHGNSFLFYSGFETGDLSEWDMTPNPNWRGNISIVNEYPFQGNYCMKAEATSSWASLVAQKFLDPPEQLIYVRAYVKFVNVKDVGDFTKFIRIFNNTAKSELQRELFQVRPYCYSDVGVRWGVSYWDDSSGTPMYGDRIGPSIQMGVWYCVEAMVEVGEGDAELCLWVDGNQVWNKTSFSNVLAGDTIDTIHVGLTENPTSYPDAIMYVDAVAIDTEPIGPEPGKQTSTITCFVEPSSLAPSEEVKIFGFISPVKTDVEVTLNCSSPNGTNIIRTVYTNSSGWYLDKFSPSQLGVWIVTASWAGDESYWGAASEAITFSVRAHTSSITINVYPQTVIIGEAVEVFGQINPPCEGASVTLYYTRPDNTEDYGYVISSTEGNYSHTYVPYYVGIWAVKAGWEGNESYTGAESEIISFAVGYFDDTPPEIQNIENIPNMPEYNETTTIKTEVTDEISGVELVTLSFNSSTSWNNVTMIPESTYYVANLSAFPYGTTVYYKIYASDNANNWNVSDTYSYQVADSIPPSIGTPYWEPEEPSKTDEVYVRVEASEPENASGLKVAVIWFQVNEGDLQVLQMTYETNTWTVKIPKQNAGTTVRFYIKTYDTAYNVATTPYYSYTVKGSGETPLTSTIVIGIIIGGAIVAILVWLKVKGKY